MEIKNKMYKKVNDMNFREYNDRFALVKNTGIDFNECNIDIVEPFYAYMYIHKEKGIIMVILGNEENEEKYVHEELLLNAEYGFFENFEIELIEDGEYEHAETVRWIYQQDCQSNENILKTREMEELDKFRADNDPDILNCQLLTKTGETIQVCAKIKEYIENNNVMIVEILDNMHSIFLAKHIKYENFETIIVLEK